MPGPPPNPNARRRNARSGPTRLPAEGRKGPAPAWPLRRASAAERALWAKVWAYPQAVAWERDKVVREVAMYVRWTLVAEEGDLKAAVEARMMSDRLGLTPMSMRRLMWEIVGDEVAEARERKIPAVSTTPGRSRPTDLRAVDGAAADG